MDWKDIGIRAGKTFLQAALAILVGSGIITAFGADGFTAENLEAAQAVLTAAVFGGLAALVSFVQNTLTAVWGDSE